MLPLIPKALPILKLKRWLLCRLWFPGISSAGIYSRSRSLPAGWLALMGTEQAAGEDEEGSPPWGMWAPRQCSPRPVETAGEQKLLAGTSRDELGAPKRICVGISGVGRELLWRVGKSSNSSQVAATLGVNGF